MSSKENEILTRGGLSLLNVLRQEKKLLLLLAGGGVHETWNVILKVFCFLGRKVLSLLLN